MCTLSDRFPTDPNQLLQFIPHHRHQLSFSHSSHLGGAAPKINLQHRETLRGPVGQLGRGPGDGINGAVFPPGDHQAAKP